MKQLTRKQRENALSVEREKMQKLFVAEYQESKKIYGKRGWGSIDENKESYVERKIQEWEREQLKVPSGRYKDPLKIQSEYQCHFAKYIQECSPNVFEELRILTSSFDKLFKEDRDKFHVLFFGLVTWKPLVELKLKRQSGE